MLLLMPSPQTLLALSLTCRITSLISSELTGTASSCPGAGRMDTAGAFPLPTSSAMRSLCGRLRLIFLSRGRAE